MSISIQAIVIKLNILQSVVSKTIKGYTDDRVKTHQLVQRTAQEVGYQPNISARSLRRVKTNKIGLFLDVQIKYVVDYLSGVTFEVAMAAQGFGKHLLIDTITDNDPSYLPDDSLIVETHIETPNQSPKQETVSVSLVVRGCTGHH